MDELVAQPATKAGVKIAVAEKSAGAIVGLLGGERRSSKARTPIDTVPGAEVAIEVSNNSCGAERRMGGGLVALGTRLMSLGLGIGETKKIARELFTYGRDKIGADQIGAIVAATPGLRQFA